MYLTVSSMVLEKTNYMLFESKEDKHPGGRIECQTS